MNVIGYAVRFCEDKSCSHSSADGNCCNRTSSKYFVDPSNTSLIAKGTPLVIAHDQKHVVGHCSFQHNTCSGILLSCEIDDYYFLECLKRRFDDFVLKYNPAISTFENYCKKTLCSFSLSHIPSSNSVRHISLVDTPGRKGTAVNYIKNQRVILKRRAENVHISDIIASHSTAYANLTDRRSYLLENDGLSYSPGDLCYINASRQLQSAADNRAKMAATNNLSTVEQFKRFLDFTDFMQSQQSDSGQKRKRDDFDCDENEPVKKHERSSEPVVSASKNTVDSNVTDELRQLKQGFEELKATLMRQSASVGTPLATQQAQCSTQQQQQQQQPAEHQEQTPAHSFLNDNSKHQMQQSAPIQVVEASKPRGTSIIITPSDERKAIEMLIGSIVQNSV